MVCVRLPVGAAAGADPAEHEDVAQTEAIHLEDGQGLRCDWSRHVVAQRAAAGGAGGARQGLDTHTHNNPSPVINNNS